MPKSDRVSPVIRYIGVDPGGSGGMACLCVRKFPRGIAEIECVSAPKTEADVWAWFSQFPGLNWTCATIEAVHSFPKQGVRSTFTFGRSYGFLRACLIAAGIPFEEVQPAVWQKALGIKKREKDESKTVFKNRLKGKAQQLFPGVLVTLATADALLIAEYCRRKREGRL